MSPVYSELWMNSSNVQRMSNDDNCNAWYGSIHLLLGFILCL